MISGIVWSFLGLFMVSSAGFWLLLALALIFLAYASDRSIIGTMFVVLLIASGLISLANHFHPIGWIIGHPLKSISGAAGYIAVGISWTLVKFHRFVTKQIADYRSSPSGNKEWLAATISPKRNKSRIMGWLMYWPFSVLRDLTINLYDTIYDLIAGLLQKISDRALSKIS